MFTKEDITILQEKFEITSDELTLILDLDAKGLEDVAIQVINGLPKINYEK
jgi:hypothetical protein